MAISVIDVYEIYPNGVDDASLAAAQQIADSVFASCGYTEAEKDRIVLWLTAHVQALIDNDMGATSIQQGERSISFGASFGDKIHSTRYGQMAISLDTCGKLADIGKRKATFNVL